MEKNAKKHAICFIVLPWQVLSEDPKVDMFCQGMIMDLITDLSRFKSFHIIAYETAKSLNPDESPDSPELSGLNLDYMIKGMARLMNNHLYLNLQLINLNENHLVWAEKFSGPFDDLFQIQEDIEVKIVTSLQHFVDFDVLSKIRKKPLTNLTVYECWLRGYQELKKGTVEADEHARSLFNQAMQLDPDNPRAYTGMSLSYFNEWSCQLWSRWELSQNGAFEWAQKALELDDWDHISNAILGRVYLYTGQYEKAEHYLYKSLQINANDAETISIVAFGLTYLGKLEEARLLYEKVKQLNPVHTYSALGAFIYFELGEYKKAISISGQQDMSKTWVDFPAFIAAAHYLIGDLENMTIFWQIFLEKFSDKILGGKPSDAQIALQWMIDVNPYRGETKLIPFWEYISQNDLSELIIKKREIASIQKNKFVREGELWTITFDNKELQLQDLKGFHDIVQLIHQPNQSIHCTELMGAQALARGEVVFDEKARADYQQRILDLQQEIEEIELGGNSERVAKLQEEYDRLIEHLSRAIGKGGKIRKVNGTVEKCRTAVTWRIRNAIKKISDHHPSLGKHFEVSVKTGIFCEYAPERKTEWTI